MSRQINESPILFCNVGWMERYQGLKSGDRITGGGAYVWKEGRGHEVCNFSPDRGFLYGYVQAPGEQINIDRMGANPTDSEIAGVTVVWTATRPRGGTAIVGWYRNATVFRSYQEFESTPRSHAANGINGFRIRAAKDEATLLPVDARTFEIPRQQKGGMGQSNVWYADAAESKALRKRVENLVLGRGNVGGGRKPKKKPQDLERKVRIKKAAIGICCKHFERLGYQVASVEKDNVGWDLVAEAGKTRLRIEVKGLSGRLFAIELTPNEYAAFAAEAGDYRLAVVTDALGAPKLAICRYSQESGAWLVEDDEGRALVIKVKESALVTCL